MTATAGTVGPTDYPTVKGAFDAINAGTHTGAITIYILGDTTEAASAVLNASGSGAASYTSMIIAPNGTRTVSHLQRRSSISMAPVTSTIDGIARRQFADHLQHQHRSLPGTSTIRFITGASNTVKNQPSQAHNCPRQAPPAETFSLANTATTGNNNNTISGTTSDQRGPICPSKQFRCRHDNKLVDHQHRRDVIDNNIFDFFIATANATGIDIDRQYKLTIHNRSPVPRHVHNERRVALCRNYFSGARTGATGNFMNITEHDGFARLWHGHHHDYRNR